MATPPYLVSLSFAGRRLVDRDRRGRALRIPPGTSQIELRYTILSSCAPQRVRFRYRLSRVDPEWVEVGARRQASYSNLPPGNYRFGITACNNDGVWNPQGAEVMLVVRPRCW